jgi:hypothetical protein
MSTPNVPSNGIKAQSNGTLLTGVHVLVVANVFTGADAVRANNEPFLVYSNNEVSIVSSVATKVLGRKACWSNKVPLY